MITPENAVAHLRRIRLDPDTYRAVTLVLAMLNDAENERDDLRAALTELTAASLDARIIEKVRCDRWHAAVNKSEQILREETE